jgi:aspartyl-tRNA(Asn)/glutamyl-tRNA(Gln) amidotransferase subunit A
MNDREITRLNISQLTEKIRSKEISPVDLTDVFLSRIEKLDSKINSFITVMKEEARKDAAKIQEMISSRDRIGLLGGIPFGIKDLIATKGTRTTSGSKFLSDFIPKYDAAVVQKIRSEGGVILGKNNLAEFAYHAVTRNPFFGSVKNPWNLEYEAGGSSGGSSAAVAASLCVASVGTDTGGSIRIPSALCANVGLKPTYGRVSTFGVTPLSWSLDHVGIIGNCVADVAIILEVIAGQDPRDPLTSDEVVPKFSVKSESSPGVRIGVPEEYFFEEGLQSDVRKSVMSTIDLLKELGARIIPISLSYMKFTRYVTVVVMSSEASAYHEKFIREHSEDYGKDTLSRLELGNVIPATWYVKAQRLRHLILDEFQRACKNVDVIITPTTPIVAPRLDQTDLEYGGVRIPVARLLPRFTSAFNLLGVPAMSMVCGFSSEGLPVGMQIIGKPFTEKMLFDIGEMIESNTEWHKRIPQL